MMYQKDFQYLAVAVEYHPLQDLNVSSQSRLATNVIVYLTILQALTRKAKVDIIVFPESTLTAHGITNKRDLLDFSTEIPDPSDNVSPCFRQYIFPAFFQQLSCAAVAFETYLVANLIERVSCAKELCRPSDTWNFYNTNVAFDRNGTVIGRYRKNISFEGHLSYTNTSNTSIILTNFGIKFGILTSYDILFKQPTWTMLKDNGVQHFILPTRWYSELPFMTALQVFQQWAYQNDVVLLAAGANEPLNGIGGSGIFQGRHGPNIYGIEENGGSKIHMAKILQTRVTDIEPEKNITVFDITATRANNFYLKTDNLTGYNSEILNTSAQTKFNITLTSGCGDEVLQCSFTIAIDFNNTKLLNSSQHYRYRTLAYSGMKVFHNDHYGGVEICAVVACLNEDLNSCGKRFDNYSDIQWRVIFKTITIKASFKLDNNRVQYPNSLLSNIRPLHVNDFEWLKKKSSKKNVIHRIYKLKRPQNRLMTFAIFGRNFNKDSNVSSWQNCKKQETGGANQIRCICLSVFFILFVCRKIKLCK